MYYLNFSKSQTNCKINVYIFWKKAYDDSETTGAVTFKEKYYIHFHVWLNAISHSAIYQNFDQILKGYQLLTVLPNLHPS